MTWGSDLLQITLKLGHGLSMWRAAALVEIMEGDVAAAPVVAPEQAPAAFNLNATLALSLRYPRVSHALCVGYRLYQSLRNSLLSRRPKSMALKLPS